MARLTGYGGAVSALDSLPLASFGGIQFPIISSDMRGGIRNHIHEFPHSSGGAPEKLGRSLYRITLQVVFDTNFRLYDNLWPGRRDDLLLKFERQETDALVIPTFNRGPIPAYCSNWTLQMTAKVRSGERAQLEFVEDSEKDISKYALVRSSGSFPRSFSEKTKSITSDDLKSAGFDQGSIDLFSSIRNAFQWVKGVIDSGTMAVDSLVAKWKQISGMCERMLESYGCNLHSNQEFTELIRAAWEYALSQQHTQQMHYIAQTYVVPTVMSITDVAMRLYGKQDKAEELAALNSGLIENQYALRPGTKLVWYQEV
jgi:hypothetical protein